MTKRPLSPTSRLRKHLGVGLCALSLGFAAQTSTAHAAPVADDENQLLSLLNAEREQRGLIPLRVEATLDAGAARHANDMANRNSLYHSAMTDSAPAGWTGLGENIGTASSAPALHELLMASPTHRATMLDPTFDYVGIGVAHGVGKTHWLSMKFADHPAADLGVQAASTDPRRLVSTTGVVSTIGGASHHGDLRGVALAAPVVGLTSTPSGAGYWLVAADGGVFAFGDAGFFGSTGALRLAQPIVGMTAMPDGSGYWLAAADGGVFAFGRAPFLGSVAGQRLPAPIARINRTYTGAGYALYDVDGRRYAFGDAG